MMHDATAGVVVKTSRTLPLISHSANLEDSADILFMIQHRHCLHHSLQHVRLLQHGSRLNHKKSKSLLEVVVISLLQYSRERKTKTTPFTMKFAKNLQRVVEIADPEWAPYWPNYKMLKVRLLPFPLFVYWNVQVS